MLNKINILLYILLEHIEVDILCAIKSHKDFQFKSLNFISSLEFNYNNNYYLLLLGVSISIKLDIHKKTRQ